MKLQYEHKTLSENKRLLKAYEDFDKELQFQNFDGFARSSIFTLLQYAYITMINSSDGDNKGQDENRNENASKW